MKLRKIFVLAVCAVLALQVLVADPAAIAHNAGDAPAQPSPVGTSYEKTNHPLSETTLTLIHDTHFHGSYGDVHGVENIVNYFGVVDQIRSKQPNSIFIANGDDLATSILSSSFQGKHIVDALNAAKVDIDTFGNHDFDMGPDILTQRIKESRFTWVSANVIDDRTQDVFGKEQGAKRFMIKEIHGVKVGLTGLINEEAPELTTMGEHAKVIPAVDAMKKIIPEMKQAGAELIVVSSHLASPDVRIVAEKVDGIDVIVGDHAAYAYETPEKIRNTLLWFIGDEFEYLGEINLQVAGGKIADFNFHRYTIKDEAAKPDFQPDAAVKQVMDAYTQQLSSDLSTVIGETKTELDVMKASQRNGETAIGDYIADAVRDYTKADVALINGGGIRAERIFPAGKLTKKDILDALPFTNYVVKIEVSGETLRKAIENGVSQIEKRAGRFPQVSGITYSFNPDQPAGARIVELKVNGKPVDPKATYTLATVDFVANGGDGYDMFKGAKVLLDANGGPLLSTLIMDTIRKQGTIAPAIDGRIKETNGKPAAAGGTLLKLRLLETTDIHVNLMNYDYYKDQPTNEFGLVKTATLIKQARAEVKNSMLFDNGDLIQGNPLGDYVAKVDVLKDGETHPVYKAMDLLDYDAGNIGNHEFNYGLEFLQRSLKGANFPYVNANVYIDDHDNNSSNDKHYFTPYLILERTFKDEKGSDQTLKIGVIGFVPPQVMQWDKSNLEGKVTVRDIVDTANQYVPEMKAKGADIIVAIPHSGFGPAVREGDEENAAFLLSKVKGIDAILFGHSHVVFPSPMFEGIDGVDLNKGTINGVAAIEPGYWGNNLGVIDLVLEKQDGKWKVVDSQSTDRPIYKKENNQTVSLADPDPEIAQAVKEDHEHTIAYVRGPVGKTTAPINSYFALVQDDPSIQIVTNAQKWYVQHHVQGTEYDSLPILSAGAPFKAGGRGGAAYYTDIPTGTIAIKNVSDLYIYPNTLKAVLLNGEQVKEWLEMSAGQFNQIDPGKQAEQPLINLDFPTYNFDVIDGVTYQIDVTQPAKYDPKGKLANPQANRIKNLMYEGKPVRKDQKFIMVTNNYRASGGGHFPGLDGSNIIIDSPDENRQVLIDYIATQKTINPTADGNWSLAPVKGNVNVTFETSAAAKDAAKSNKQLHYLTTLDSGFAKFAITFDASKSSKPNHTSVKIYIVREGDWLSTIAPMFDLQWQELAEYNHLENPDKIYVGQKLMIPAK